MRVENVHNSSWTSWIVLKATKWGHFFFFSTRSLSTKKWSKLRIFLETHQKLLRFFTGARNFVPAIEEVSDPDRKSRGASQLSASGSDGNGSLYAPQRKLILFSKFKPIRIAHNSPPPTLNVCKLSWRYLFPSNFSIIPFLQEFSPTTKIFWT